MNQFLKDKNVLITGASRGIGKSIAMKFAENGANLAFTYLSSEQSANELQNTLSAHGNKIKAYRSDASLFNEAEILMQNVLNDFSSIDIIVNNAGITRDNLLLRMSEKDWDDVISINLKSCFNICKQAAKTMIRQKSGSIINISSIVGLKGNPGQTNYSASKAGIIGFSKALALELGSRNIRVNVIAPGFIITEMTATLPKETMEQYQKNIPLKRFGESAEVANCALFLASDLSAYITGQVIQVDGGLLT